ncbi:hypothetical protein AYO21_09520 [Fonsecaea monophora]|uniref:Uncharacterized protein n=1 Tax=Fonsecaea monophora TaxID=254056 RepID=A0A177EWF3_9EURO|nr:hypothetical protein AYO21_09520 [Fonsecaea monophora]OAG36278.1 hypothetical protein AYO21_09520 [Fonsecaea monophora]
MTARSNDDDFETMTVTVPGTREVDIDMQNYHDAAKAGEEDTRGKRWSFRSTSCRANDEDVHPFIFWLKAVFTSQDAGQKRHACTAHGTAVWEPPLVATSGIGEARSRLPEQVIVTDLVLIAAEALGGVVAIECVARLGLNSIIERQHIAEVLGELIISQWCRELRCRARRNLKFSA